MRGGACSLGGGVSFQGVAGVELVCWKGRFYSFLRSFRERGVCSLKSGGLGVLKLHTDARTQTARHMGSLAAIPR